MCLASSFEYNIKQDVPWLMISSCDATNILCGVYLFYTHLRERNFRPIFLTTC